MTRQLLFVLAPYMGPTSSIGNTDAMISELALASINNTDLIEKTSSMIEDLINDTRLFSTDEQLFARIADYIRQNLDKVIALESLCTRFYLSQTRLSRLFREFSGMSVHEFMTGERIKRAQQLIDTNPEMKMSDVSAMCGYDDQHYFSRVFRNIVGVTPSDYRKGKT